MPEVARKMSITHKYQHRSKKKNYNNVIFNIVWYNIIVYNIVHQFSKPIVLCRVNDYIILYS